MIVDESFLAPRPSFLLPIPELELVADLLSLAADCLLVDDEVEARAYLAEADMAAVRSYTRSIASQVDTGIHRLRHVPDLAAVLPKAQRGRRQPSAAVELGVYQRDGFRCRYCGCRIVHPKAQSCIAASLPGAVHWGTRDAELNAAFYTLRGVLDVVPHANGGSSEPGNLVVSCQPCNYGKGNFFIEQLGLSDPRLRPPRVDEWDGLRRVLFGAEGASPTVAALAPATPPNLLAGLGEDDRARLQVLIAALDRCSDLDVCWSIDRVLMVRMTVGSSCIEPLAVEADGTVQVPWSVGPHKEAFRSFAETLAAAMPLGRPYETSKMWRVRCGSRMPKLADLPADGDALREAFVALRNRLSEPEYVPSADG